MVPSSYFDRKKMLINLIYMVSELGGGDCESFLKSYIDEIILKYRPMLNEPITCFENLLTQGCVYAKISKAPH